MMKRWIGIMGVVSAVGVVGGCESENFLKFRQDIPRADLGLDAQTARVPATRERGVIDEVTTPGIEDRVVGTYTFVVPETVTQIKKTGETLTQYLLYFGTPAAEDRPIVRIEIGPKVESEAMAGTGEFKSLKDGVLPKLRVYSLNGLEVHEYSGHTAAGLPFCELVVSHGDGGDELHAVAVARDAETRKVALDVLGSIGWKAAK